MVNHVVQLLSSSSSSSQSTENTENRIMHETSLPFFLLSLISNLLIIAAFSASPKLRQFYSRLVIYLAVSDLVWDVSIIVQIGRFLGGKNLDADYAVCLAMGNAVFFKMFSAIWDVFIAFTMYMKIVKGASTESYEVWVAVGAALWSVATMILLDTVIGQGPAGIACSAAGPRAVYGDQIVFYMTIYACIIAIVVFYGLTINHIVKIWRKVGDRSPDDTVHRRAVRHLLLLPVVTLIVWIPPIGRRAYDVQNADTLAGVLIANIGNSASGVLNLILWGSSKKIWNVIPGCGGEGHGRVSGTKSVHAVDLEEGYTGSPTGDGAMSSRREAPA